MSKEGYNYYKKTISTLLLMRLNKQIVATGKVRSGQIQKESKRTHTRWCDLSGRGHHTLLGADRVNTFSLNKAICCSIAECFILLQNEVLFQSWNEIINGNGAFMKSDASIYSFDGRDVMSDGQWYVEPVIMNLSSTSQISC